MASARGCNIDDSISSSGRRNKSRSLVERGSGTFPQKCPHTHPLHVFCLEIDAVAAANDEFDISVLHFVEQVEQRRLKVGYRDQAKGVSRSSSSSVILKVSTP